MDSYERVKQLGRGAFGVAYLVRAKDSADDQLRVVKQVDLTQLNPSAQREALTEVKVLAGFSHPNIVGYCDAFINDRTLHIVMEFADGGDLAAAIRQRKDSGLVGFSDDDSLTVLAQSLQALQHMHSKRVLHRDIKCQNIFLTVNGSVKLGDFGISKVLEHTASAAKTVIGTPSYLAPEVCESKPYGSKADIWSLGVVLFELLSLQTPFQASNMAAIVLRIVTAEPPPLPEACGDVQELVSATLQKLPERRPNTDELLNRPSVRRRVGAKFQPFSTATPKRQLSQEACAASPSSGFTRRDAELLASTLKPCQPHGDSPDFEFGAPWPSNEDTLQELVQTTRMRRVGAAVTPTEATRRRGRQPEPAPDQQLALEQRRRNQEMAEAIKVRVQGPSFGYSPGDGYSSGKRPISSGRLAPPDSSTFYRPGTSASRPGTRGSQSSVSPQAEMGLIAMISGGHLGDQQIRPLSRDGPEATLARMGSQASFSRPSSRGSIRSRPSSRGSIRSASGCAGASIMGFGGTGEEPVEQARPPTASELAGRFAWATKFADAKLDMPLWAGPTGTPENRKRDSLEKIIQEFAQMGEGDLESTPVADRKRTDGGTNFSGARFDDTESWDAATVLREPTGEEATLWSG